MEEAEDQHAQSGLPGPAIGSQKGKEGCGVCHLHQHPALEVGHKDNGDYNLIGREAKEKSHKDDPVQSHKLSQGIKKSGQMKEKALAVDGSIGQDPDDQPGGGCHGRCAAQHKQRAVKDGAHQHFADLRTAVGRQFQGKGGWDSF